MSENKFYIPLRDPFDNKRGELFSRDIQWVFKGKVERLKLDTVIDTKCNNFFSLLFQSILCLFSTDKHALHIPSELNLTPGFVFGKTHLLQYNIFITHNCL